MRAAKTNTRIFFTHNTILGAEERCVGPPSHSGDSEQGWQRTPGIQCRGRCQQSPKPPGDHELLLGVSPAEDGSAGAAAAGNPSAGRRVCRSGELGRWRRCKGRAFACSGLLPCPGPEGGLSLAAEELARGCNVVIFRAFCR